MELEQQVCSLDLAKRLKELGVKQESVCYWSERYQLSERHLKNTGVRFTSNPDFSGTSYSYHHEQDICSAFTVAELGAMLPKDIQVGKILLRHYTRKAIVGEQWAVGYQNATTGNEHGLMQFADTEADARAKMLCYLLENKLLNS